jgi:predicted Zn finger-like uncharacterized protein
MKIVCDACSAKYSIADDKVRGKVFKIRCKKCSNIIVVRGTTNGEGEAHEEQRDSRLFDEHGEDGEMAEDAIWHVVVDQEQVGPLTPAEVRQRFAQGQIDAETYTWREGFADWQPLASISEFADLNGGGGGGLFAGAAAAGGDLGRSDAGDLFAAAAAQQASEGASLFSGGGGATVTPSAVSASAASSDGLFARNGTGDSGMQVAGGESGLKGQRNENSVLFSLSNLASLASDAPPKAAAPAPSSGNAGHAPGHEGSGLIDIRSMAQVYLGDRDGGKTAAGSADDLPVFSQTSFEAASPVLLPTQAAASTNKIVYVLFAVVGVLVVAATALIIVVLKNRPAAPVAVATPAAAAPATATAAGNVPPAGGEQAGSTPPGASGTGATPPEPAVRPGEPAAVPGGRQDDRASGTEQRSGDRRDRTDPGRTGRRDREDKEPEDDKGRRGKTGGTEQVDRKGGGDSGGESCDEVTCLVEPNKPCCAKYRKGGRRPAAEDSGGDSDLPEHLERSDISSGMSSVHGRVTSCGDRFGGKGTVKVKMKIEGSGKVSSVEVSGASGGLASCVESAVKQARFRKTQKGMTVTYPFVLR